MNEHERRHFARYLPPVSDRDRTAAAYYMAEKLWEALRARNPEWLHYMDSGGRVTSERKPGR